MEIRRATTDDARPILDYLARLYAGDCRTIRRLDPLPTTAEERAWLTQHDGERGVVFVAAENGRVIGVINADATGRTSEIGMSVLQSYRNRGLGRRLIEAVSEWAATRGLVSIQLDVYAINEPAIHLYASLGFVEVGRQKAAVDLGDGERCDLVRMARRLEADGDAASVAKVMIARFFERVSARDPGVLDEFAAGDDVLLAGSDAGEIARGREELAAFFPRLFTRPTTFAYEVQRVDASRAGDLVWFFAEGRMTVASADGRRTVPYSISGVLERYGERWLWRQYHGSEPVSAD